MNFFHRLCSTKFSARTSKWAIYAALAAFFLVPQNATAAPLMILNPFVSMEITATVQGILPQGDPVIILNPYVKPLASVATCPYRCILPSPQIIFPARLK